LRKREEKGEKQGRRRPIYSYSPVFERKQGKTRHSKEREEEIALSVLGGKEEKRKEKGTAVKLFPLVLK